MWSYCAHVLSYRWCFLCSKSEMSSICTCIDEPLDLQQWFFVKKKTKQQNILNSNGFWRHNEQVSRIIRTTTIINRIWNQQSNKGFFVAAHLSISINNRIIFVLNFAQRCGVNAVNRIRYIYHILLVYLSIP